ncbi:MAG: OmpH family outer membrane protein [Gammaproteobacteria bacterium]
MLTLFAALLYAGNAGAADIRIGEVDMQKLMQESPQALAATKQMEQKFGSRRNDIVAQQNKVKNLQDQINRNGAVMSAAQLQSLQSQLDTEQQDLSRKESDFQADLNEWKNQQLGVIQQDVIKEVQAFAKAQKYNLIIGVGVLYADGTVDVTDQVLSRLQKDFKAPGASPAGGGN